MSERLGSPRVHLRRTDSTNVQARALAIAGAPHGTLVTACEQTAGRGRQGRRWLAPAGSALLMSLLVREPPSLLPLIAALAVCDAAGAGAQVKWPNDVVLALAEGAAGPGEPPRPGGSGLGKLAGILLEGRPQEGWAVVGIGLNVAVRLEELAPQLACAAEAGADAHGTRAGRGEGAGAAVVPGARGPLPPATLGLPASEIEPMLARVLEALARRLAEPAAETLRAWGARDALRGREIAWAGGHGHAQGIDGTGRLVVSLDDGGRTTLQAGEVHLHELR